ncbi:hypothetical protein ACWCXB_34450 [Streptomyces sp. NPDC001514]
MAAWQDSALSTMTTDQATATATTATATGATADPYRFPGAADFLLPAPDPGQRLSMSLSPMDRRRLDLHAALTAAGIPPLPGDLEAIEALCLLDDTTNATVQRWITSTP